MGIRLGAVPDELEVVLCSGAGFQFGLRGRNRNHPDDPLPAGLVVDLVFGDGTVWGTTITGNLILWAEPVAAVTALVQSRTRDVGLYWRAVGAQPLLWASGQVIVT